MPSPICSVKDGAGAFVASTTKVVVTPGNVITIALDAPAGAGVWELTCTSADELSDAAAITASISINQVTKQATFTCPADPARAYIFLSRVQGGVGPLTTGGYGTRSDYETSFKIYTASVGGLDVGAVGETTEGGPVGMAESINSLIRAGGSSSVPTGTGVTHIVGGVQSAAASLIVNADVDAAAAISVSKLAAGTNTHVLTTVAGVPTWAAPSGGGGSVPTGTGFYGVTSGSMDAAAIKVNLASGTYVTGTLAVGNGGTGITSFGAGVATWLGTPSSANLASALTDETGSGEVVFSTTPTFKTSVKVNNPANTFAYTLTPTAIAANRTLNLPLLTGTDTLVGEAHTATLTNKTIAAGSNTITGLANANIDAAAAIAVSKLAAGTNTYVLTTTGGVPVWAAPTAFTPPTGTGVALVSGGALVGAAGTVNLASGTYVSGTLAVANGGTGITSFGAGVATWLGTPSSANLAAAVTDETGSGSLVFGTAPTFKTTLTLRNPADTFSYIFTPAAIAANRTLTLPLLTGNDTMVTEAFTQTLTNKTISGASNTITNVSLTSGVTGTLPVANGGTGITSLGAGVATWLGTPSSANLRSAMTDETGTGELVFSTTPTFKTSINVNNPANTFAYTLTPAAIVANRTLNLPLLTATDTLVAEAFTQTLTNKTINASSNTLSNIANTHISSSAAIAVSKLAAGTDTHVLTTVAGIPTWAAPSGGGGSVPTGTGFYTVTSGVMDAASAPYAAGVLTFLATPSSANLRSMLTDESGTGEAIFSTSPTFKTGVLLNNPANTFAYTFTPAAIVANRTITLPLLGGNDTMVTEAFTQTLTNKTINGSNNTITNVAISTAVSGLGTNVATFLGTPSSANLRAALTDETGTGAAVFATSPTLTTPVIASITNTGTLTLPTSTDTLVGRATTDTLTNKTINASSNTISNIANANVSASAAIAGTKIDPDFGSQLVQTAGDMLATNILATGYFHTDGSPTPTTGNIRLNNTHKITSRNGANSANVCIAQYSASDVVYYGLNSSFGEQAYGIIAGSSNYMYFAVASTYYVHLEGSEVRMGQPVVGDDTVYAAHGSVNSSYTNVDYTIPAAEYKFYTVSFTSTGASAKTVTFPHPSSLARSYIKNIRNGTEHNLTISTGTGTTIAVTSYHGVMLEFTNGGVRYAGNEYAL